MPSQPPEILPSTPPSAGAAGTHLLGILRRMALREPRSLDDFFQACSGALLGIGLQMLGSREDAEEVLQDTLVRVWKKAADFDARLSAPYTWVVMLHRGLCLDRLRARGRRLQPLPLEPHWDAPALQNCDPAVVADVRAAWEGLGAEDQALLSRAVFSPDTTASLAASAGEPLGTLKARVHRAMGRFFQRIQGSDAPSAEL